MRSRRLFGFWRLKMAEGFSRNICRGCAAGRSGIEVLCAPIVVRLAFAIESNLELCSCLSAKSHCMQ